MELDASSVFAVSVLVVQRRKKRSYRAAHHHAVDHLSPTPPRRRPSRLANHHQSGSHPPSLFSLRRPSMTPASMPPTAAVAVTVIGLSLSKMAEPVRRTTKQCDDAGGSDGGVGDLQDSGVSGGEARLSGDDGTTEGFRCVERHFRRVEKPALATSVTRWSMVCRRLVEAAMARRREIEAHGGGCFFFFR
nr:hypothetical protein Iba_chr05aCG8360 [Ipomoea batatas]